MISKLKRIAYLVLSSLVLICSPTLAQDMNVVAHVDRTTVELGSYLELTVQISGGQVNSPEINLPTIADVQSRPIGPVIINSIVNGNMSGSYSFRYNLFPQKVGKFQIPAIPVTVNGQNYITEPIAIEVVDAAATPAPTGGANPPASAGTRLQDKIFLVMNVPKKEVYLNEKIPLKIRLFSNGIPAEVAQFPEMEYLGFTVDPFQEGKQYEQVAGGVQYKVIEFNTFIYPTRTGELTLGPAKLPCSLIFKSQGHRQDMFSDFNSIFGEDVFSNFFNTVEKHPITLQSQDVAIKVLPLPAEGKPKDFVETLGGAVGQFDMEASVSPTDIKVGDPITLRLKIKGVGNFKTVAIPVLQGDPTENQKNFKFYDPQVKEEEGTKTFEQVVIPAQDKVKELPAINFSYFDVTQNQYQTISKGPFPLNIQKPQPGEELKVVGLHPSSVETSAEPEELGKDISFIKDQPGFFRASGLRLYQGIPFWIINGLSVLLWGFLLAHYRIRHRLKTDVKFARRLHAPRQARLGLQQAKGYLEQGQQKEFYDGTFKTLQNYFANKFHLQAGAISLATIKQVAKSKNGAGPIFEKIEMVFDECEMVRFASAQVDKEKMQTIFRLVEEIIDFSERNWR